MKTKMTTLLMAIFCVTCSMAVAQSANADDIKILPAASNGVVKVLYPFAAKDGVRVTFSNSSGVVKTDKIRGSFENGILKKYDVSNINDGYFRVEVSSAEMSIVYRIVPSGNNQSFTAYKERTTYLHPVVASK